MRTFAVLLFTLSVFTGTAHANDGAWHSWFTQGSCKPSESWCLGPEVGWTGGNVSVGRMPFSVRDVPNYPDDTYTPENDRFPVEKDQYDAIGTLAVGLTGFKRLFHDRLRLGAGLDWMLPFTDEGHQDYSRTTATNGQLNKAKAYAALRLRGVVPDLESVWANALVNITPKLFAEIPITSWIAGGVSLSYFSADAENGWKWSKYPKSDSRQTLGSFIPIEPYIQLGLLRVGASYPIPVSESSLGSEAHLSSNITYKISLRYLF